jgi:hypothetical protein
MTAFLASLVFVVLAETGDKTQLLAMALIAFGLWGLWDDLPLEVWSAPVAARRGGDSRPGSCAGIAGTFIPAPVSKTAMRNAGRRQEEEIAT